MRALDLFCGAGGVSMGLHRAGFDVTGVDNRPQPRYPFRFVQADALDAPLDLADFDFVWASPPCQDASVGSRRWKAAGREYPKLIEATRALLAGHPMTCIENVPGAAMRADPVLTGAIFGLNTYRRRHFELSFPVPQPPIGRPFGPKTRAGSFTAAGHGGHGPNRPLLWAKGMGVEWMTDRYEIAQAIPPVYAEFIGRGALAHLAKRVPPVSKPEQSTTRQEQQTMTTNVRIEITADSAEEARREMQALIGVQTHTIAWRKTELDDAYVAATAEAVAGEPSIGLGDDKRGAHASDCAVHNEPAMPAGECDCGAEAPKPEQTEAPKRRRRTKAEIEADKAAEAAANAPQPEKAPANDGEMPAFLRRDEPAPIAETAQTEQPSAKKRYAIFFPSGEKFSDVGLGAAVKRLLEWGDVADADGLAALIEANKDTLAEMPSDERRHIYAQWDARAQDLEKGAPAMTYDDAKAALVAAAEKPGGTAAALRVLKELGANKISEIEPHRFAEFIDKLRAATGQEAVA